MSNKTDEPNNMLSEVDKLRAEIERLRVEARRAYDAFQKIQVEWEKASERLMREDMSRQQTSEHSTATEWKRSDVAIACRVCEVQTRWRLRGIARCYPMCEERKEKASEVLERLLKEMSVE